MRRIVNGLIYDTETAERIISVSIAPDENRAVPDAEALYRTRLGRCFLIRHYGPGNRWGPLDNLLSMSESDVLTWCAQKHFDINWICEHFEVKEA